MGKEQEARLLQEVQRSQVAFFDNPNGHRLRAMAARVNPAALYNCYFVDHIPDQGEDIYTLLVDGSDVFSFSVERETNEIALERHEIMPASWQAGTWSRAGQLILRLARQKRREFGADLSG